MPDVRITCVPYDSGFLRWRMGGGPDVLAGALIAALDAVGVSAEADTITLPNEHTPEIAAAFALITRIARRVRRAAEAGEFPIVLAGNCNSAVGTLAGLSTRAAPSVAWFDAHADFHTPETTSSGFFDGMALSMVVGECFRELCASIEGYRATPSNLVALCGARATDESERPALQRCGVHQVA